MVPVGSGALRRDNACLNAAPGDSDLQPTLAIRREPALVPAVRRKAHAAHPNRLLEANPWEGDRGEPGWRRDARGFRATVGLVDRCIADHVLVGAVLAFMPWHLEGPAHEG